MNDERLHWFCFGHVWNTRGNDGCGTDGVFWVCGHVIGRNCGWKSARFPQYKAWVIRRMCATVSYPWIPEEVHHQCGFFPPTTFLFRLCIFLCVGVCTRYVIYRTCMHQLICEAKSRSRSLCRLCFWVEVSMSQQDWILPWSLTLHRAPAFLQLSV